MGGLSVGLPRLHKEVGDRRGFLPGLVGFLGRVGAREIVLEEGYGEGMDLAAGQYLEQSERARLGSYEECFAQDLVVALRCPDEAMIRRMRRGSLLASMLHFPTRPKRVALLRELGVRGVSLDQVTDDLGTRLVQNMEAVGWNGVRAAVRELAKIHPRFFNPGRRPIRVTLMGSGAVGGHAAHAAVRYGDLELRRTLAEASVPGVEVTIVDFELTSDENYMLTRLEKTDLLIDATQRPDPSRPIVPNQWIAALPQHAVILDLSVDPYDFTLQPSEVKGIEGIPEGNLDKYVFPPDDPAYDALPAAVPRRHRRTALACYSWPGLEPTACMTVYGKQIEPVLRVLLEGSLDKVSPAHGTYYERAVARADLHHWKEAGCH